MQNYNILQFDVCKGDKIFTIVFETISKERNHFELYKEIKNSMIERANSFWNLQAITNLLNASDNEFFYKH